MRAQQLAETLQILQAGAALQNQCRQGGENITVVRKLRIRLGAYSVI